eukprot:1958010-Prymnesium_polylepis.1
MSGRQAYHGNRGRGKWVLGRVRRAKSAGGFGGSIGATQGLAGVDGTRDTTALRGCAERRAAHGNVSMWQGGGQRVACVQRGRRVCSGGGVCAAGRAPVGQIMR